MASRLAMVACTGSNEGPWARPRGNETGIFVTGIGEGEHLRMDYEYDSKTYSKELREGLFSFVPCKRFRFVKIGPAKGGTPTSVEIRYE